jgi:hypothetical protein
MVLKASSLGLGVWFCHDYKMGRHHREGDLKPVLYLRSSWVRKEF